MSTTTPTLHVQGKIAIVTGGSRGIGLATAHALAEAGATVVIASRKQATLDEAAAQLNEALGAERVLARACHMGEREAIEGLVAWCEETVGLPDILVNNAATNPYFGPMLDTPDAAWDKTFEVNLRGYFEATRAVATRLKDAGRPGSIINVTSIMGQLAAPAQGVYGMTKAAIISMTKTLAVELGHDQIRVNAIAPGLVDTRFAATLTSSPELSAFFTDRAALHRFGLPHEIAGAAVFLASDASTFITGQTLTVDGGFTIA